MQAKLLEKFLRYSAISSQSDARATRVPSSLGQLELAKLLRAELDAMGVCTHLDEHGILYAHAHGRAKTPAGAASVGFCVHLDTIDVGLSPHVRAQVLRYEGRDLDLGEAVFRASEHPEAAPYVGCECIFSRGDSVLGADDKAAICVLMQLFSEHAKLDEAARCGLFGLFVPDEEIGLRGARLADLARFCPEFAYTIDCCAEGELMPETFNAASAELEITGVCAHPMSAKGVLINPITLLREVAAKLDAAAVPEHTEGREGYIWLCEAEANPSRARAIFHIREHDEAKFAAKKRELQAAVNAVAQANERASLDLVITDTYANLARARRAENEGALDALKAAFAAAGVEPKILAMRGGTDGSALAERGIYAPNFFTGALNFHSKFEFLPLCAFERSYRVAAALAGLANAEQVGK